MFSAVVYQASDLDELYAIIHQSASINRTLIFPDELFDKFIPKFQMADSLVPSPVFVGDNYRPDGLAIIGINPGGGNFRTETRTLEDELMYPAIHRFRSVDSGFDVHYQQDLGVVLARVIPGWSLYKQHIKPVLEAASVDISDVVYANALPFRCLNDSYPTAKRDMNRIISACVHIHLFPILLAARPSMVVFLGKQVEKYFKYCWPNFNLPYLVWDREQSHSPRREESRKNCITQLGIWAKQNF